MRIRFNPQRAFFFLTVIFLWMFRKKIEQLPHIRLPRLDQVHTIAALAIIGITIVGLVRLWVNFRNTDD